MAIQYRKAEPEDFDTVYELISAFHAMSPYNGVPLNRDHIQTLYDNATVFVSHPRDMAIDGFIAGVLNPFMLNPELLIAHEFAWYAPNGGGRELREAFEDWAKENGAHAVQFSTLEPRARENLMQNGYVPVELSLIKVL